MNTLSGLNAESAKLLSKDLKRVHDDTKDSDMITKKCAGKFNTGYDKFFGTDGSKTPSPSDLVGLMLEGEYDFKEAVDGLNRNQKGMDKTLYNQCREKKEFTDRGRKQGRERRNSFSNPHAGITDHVFRQEGTENFFEKDVVHAKGTFEGDPKSDTYKKFAEQGAPFIGGVSGTMQGLVMAWELEKPLKDVPKDKQDEVRAEREKLIGIYMATLLAGGHHSASELLFSAQSYGYFDKVADPLTNYPKAMKELGVRFIELGLPGGMSPKAGTIWLAARTEVSGSLLKLASEITATYKNEAYAITVDGQYKTEIQDKTEALFGDDLARKLDDIVAEVDDKVKRKKLTDEAGTMIETYRKTLTDEDLIRALDENPFVALSIRKTISGALDQVASLAR